MLTADKIVHEIRRHGGALRVAGEELRVRFGTAPTPELTTAIREHKAEVIAVLSRPAAWTAADWQAFYDERCGILEFDGQHTRQEAERLALEETVSHWRATHLPAASAAQNGCVHCRAGAGDKTLVPHLAANNGTLWLHTTCWPAFNRARRDEALEALHRLIPGLPGRRS